MTAQLAVDDLDVQLHGDEVVIASAFEAPELSETSLNHIRRELTHIDGIHFGSITKKKTPRPQSRYYLAVRLPRRLARANRKLIVEKFIPNALVETAAAGHLRAAA